MSNVVAQLRKLFEDSVYERYVKGEYAKVVDGFVPTDFQLVPKQEFFKMKGNGLYVADPINFSWEGYYLGFRDAMNGQKEGSNG